MSLNGQVPNGSAQDPIEIPSLQTVIGINFGNSFASIAVLTKEGLAECIANEDGERQVACAISFHGEETYIGNEAKQQLVKNSANTIIGFRNLLGKKFSELPKDRSTSSAPVIQHPDIPDTPAYKVQVLLPAPSPLSPPASSAQTPRTNNTPAASQLATPRSEPIPGERILTPADVTTLFLRSLLQSAEAFLGKPVDGAVLTVPGWFEPAQMDALQEAASAAGIRVLQLLDDAGAAALCATANASTAQSSGVGPDRTQLVVDLGASSLSLSLLAVRQGLFHHLTPPAHHLEDAGGDAIDDRLLKFFAKDFAKKTGVPLKVAPAGSDAVADLRAEARLRLALLHTKRTIAASSFGGSSSTATCAVESLKDGLDYTGSINRLRFDMEAAPIYATVVARAGELLQRAGLDWVQVDEVVYAGGSACLSGLDAALAVRLSEDATTPFITGTVAGGGIGDPTTILARGAALQARLLAEIAGGTGVEDGRVRKAFERGSEHAGVKATTRTIGVLFPEAAESGGLGGQWVGGIKAETALPARRTYALEVDLGEYVQGGEKLVGLEVWEVKEGVKIEKVKPPKDEDEDEEEEDETEVTERTISKEVYLGALTVRARQGRKGGSGWRASIEVQFLIGASGQLQVSAYETGKGGAKDVMPYSELANWDGSLSDVVDTLGPPSPSKTPSLAHDDPPMYDQYHQSNHQTSLSAAATHISTSSHFGSSSDAPPLFPPSAAVQESSSSAAVFLSPQEREIMADITLDPDDDPDPELFSGGGGASAAAIGAWAWAALKNDNEDASWDTVSSAPAQPKPQKSRSQSVIGAPVVAPPATTATQQYPIVPAPLGVGLGVASASVSPSPFAPPPASAPIAGPVSHSPPLPSSSSTNLTAKAKSPDVVRVHPDQLALSSDLDAGEHPAGSEYVMEHTSVSTLHPDDGEAGPGGNSTAGHLNAFTHDPPDPPQPRAPSRQSPVLPPLDTTNRSSSSGSSPRRSPKTPLFLPSPSESVPSHTQSDPLPPEESDPPDAISIHSSSSSSSSPPPLRRPRRRNARIKSKTNKQGRQMMAHVLIPPLPSGARKSDYVPLEKLLRMRKRRVAAKNKAPIGDNASSSALVAALQGAFENNSIGEGSTKTPGARRKREKTKAVVPVEVVEVVDDVDESEDVGELRNKGSNNLARALSSAFAHNSADPKVAARPDAVAKGRTYQLRRSTHAEVSGNSSANVEVILPPPPTKRSRPRLRTRVTSDADDSNTISSRRRNEKRQPQTPTSPQKKKRRRLARRGDGGEGEEEDEEEIEIIDRVSRELPRRASRTKPHSLSKAERSDPTQSKLSRTSKQPRASTPSPAPISARTSLPSPSPSPPPESPTASPPDTNSLGLPLTILPAPAATDIVIPPRALSHLHASSGLPGPKFETRHQESVQGFHSEEAAVGAHGLLESPSVVAAISSAVPTTTTTTAISIPTTIDSSIRANSTSPQNLPMDLGLDVIVPMDVTDGEQEQMQERQDAVQAAVVPPHALRISSSTHPDGPMLGFMLSEHDDARRTTSLSADTETSSDAIGVELGAKTTPDMEFMLLDSMDHNSALNADPGWVSWHATAPSTGLVIENEFVGDGTIDPSVLGGAECSSANLGGGSPNKAVFRSDDFIRSSLFIRARDNDKSLDNHDDEDSDDLGDEGDVMGLLFENSTDGGTVSRPPSAHGAGGKGKSKDTATVDGADARLINTDIKARAGGTRKRRKSWRQALADENDNTDHCEDTDTESHDTVERPYLSNVSNNLSSSVTRTFCHHCRRKTFRPKMCCTRINESTGKQCRKMYCDHCIEKRYPSLTFDEFATSFSCPCCGNFCNCTHCARRRGETYIPERKGGWRRWAALFPVAAPAATPTSPSRKEASRDVVDLAEPGRNRTRAKAALTAQQFLEAHDIVPVEPAAIAPLPLPQPHSTSNTLISSPHHHVHPIPTTSTATTNSLVDKKRCRHVYIGKWQKSWGRLASVPDPDPDPGLGRGSGRNGRKRKRAVRTRSFVGSKEPLLSSQKRANTKARKSLKNGRGRKKKGLETEKNGQRQIASSLPPSRSSSIAAGDEGGANQNAALYEEHDPDPDADVDKGDWPGEYGHAHAHDAVVPPGVTVSGVVATTISPEELERAIGAAFAAGIQF